MIFITLATILGCVGAWGVETLTLNGVLYKVGKNGEASAEASRAKDPWLHVVQIPEYIRLSNRTIPVTSIARNGFKDCRGLVMIALPNSIRHIGANAFSNCTKLETVVLPDKATVEITPKNFGDGGRGPFDGCTSLRAISGNLIQLPDYVLTDALRECTSVPFVYNAQTVQHTSVDQASTLQPTQNGLTDRNTFALVIGNEHYLGNIKEVPYANNDAEIFARYCRKTLGLSDANVRMLKDATLGQLANAIEELRNKAASVSDARIIFYYSGHGKPDDKDRQAYLVPVDASPYSNRTNYSLSDLYRELGEASANMTLVFLDACFSSATRTDDMLVAARAVRIVPREGAPTGNMVVFSAASEAETAYPIEDKGHGLFTYAVLSKLRETAGNVSLGELADAVTEYVTSSSLMSNRPQHPGVKVSPTLANWESLPLALPSATTKSRKKH